MKNPMKLIFGFICFLSISYCHAQAIQSGEKIAKAIRGTVIHCLPVERVDGEFNVNLKNESIESDSRFSSSAIRVNDISLSGNRLFLSFRSNTTTYWLDIQTNNLPRYSKELGGIDGMELFTLYYSKSTFRKSSIAPVSCYIRK